ncbi:MAG TPA: hypothetical protein PLN19_07075 [Methanothrix sp.]|nr:hypothetical protein [Methanothrix sp.]HPC90020.1 hypothetical protein [Methanothrix sp.]HQE88015.1 hypothetical protein [Methanothrix sp.]HRS84596.1 hypothetical protein [Methanothrix sp.]HRT16988.1 hypothetical protein [Methanothrix sp.]
MVGAGMRDRYSEITCLMTLSTTAKMKNARQCRSIGVMATLMLSSEAVLDRTKWLAGQAHSCHLLVAAAHGLTLQPDHSASRPEQHAGIAPRSPPGLTVVQASLN